MGLERITREERDRRGGESLWGFCAGRPLLAAAAEVEWVQEAKTPERRARPRAPSTTYMWAGWDASHVLRDHVTSS